MNEQQQQKNGGMEIPGAIWFALTALLRVCWGLGERQQELLSELFLPPFSRSNLAKEHLACPPWNDASLLLWPLLFPSQ